MTISKFKEFIFKFFKGVKRGYFDVMIVFQDFVNIHNQCTYFGMALYHSRSMVTMWQNQKL